jgi:outer membrane protein W
MRSALVAFNYLIKNNFSREAAKARRTAKNIKKSSWIVCQREKFRCFPFVVLYFFAASREIQPFCGE